MKKLATSLALASLIAASTAQAGSLTYVEPAAPMMVEEEAPMGSSGAWIIPLIAIGLIALAISQDDDNGPQLPQQGQAIEELSN